MAIYRVHIGSCKTRNQLGFENAVRMILLAVEDITYFSWNFDTRSSDFITILASLCQDPDNFATTW